MDNSKHPYFIGITLPDSLSKQLFDVKWSLHHSVNGSLKPLVPHVTLLHPSSLRTSRQEDLLPLIRSVADQLLPFTMTLETIGHFSRSVLYISVHSLELEDLQAKLVKLLPADKQTIYHQRSFQPHITLLQTKLPETLAIEDLSRDVERIIALPVQVTVDSLAYFVQERPREYSATTL